MEDYIISGIQQIGIGVQNFKEAWKEYIDLFHVDVRILEDDTIAERMLPYTGNQPQKRHAAIAVNLQGGGGFEIWQYSERKPKPVDFIIQYGDLGIFAAKIKSPNVRKAWSFFSTHPQLKHCFPIFVSVDGKDSFYVEDLRGNVFQIIEDQKVFSKRDLPTGGIAGAVIGVTDIEKTLLIYRDILGYDLVLADETGIFEDLQAFQCADKTYRRVVLSHSKERQGAFSRLFGSSQIELVQMLEGTPRRIYEGRFWGDPGFIQICFDVRNMDALQRKCEAMGFPFTVDSQSPLDGDQSFQMGEAAGRFTYIEDPDGTLIEFVETQRIPLFKKMGISLNMSKREPSKRLPSFLIKLLRLRRVQLS